VVTVSLLLYGCESYKQLAAVEVGPQLQRDFPKQPPHASKYGQALEADGLLETRVTARRQLVALWLTIALAVVAMLMAKAAPAQAPSPPPSATALCRDGTYSFSKHRSGSCSHHGGVATWLTPDARIAPSRDTAHLITQVAPSCGGACGVERWSVKTLSDADRERVRLADTVNTTIEALVQLQRPVILPTNARPDSVELTVYRVEARLLWLFTEADRDYHLVLASPQDTTITRATWRRTKWD